MGAVEDPPRRLIAVIRAQSPSRLVQVPVHGVLGQAQFAGNFLGAHVAVDESKAFALTLGEAIKAFDLIRKRVLALGHLRNLMRTSRPGKAPEY